MSIRSRSTCFISQRKLPSRCAAKSSYLGRVYLDWAAFPYVKDRNSKAAGYLVEFQDLRYTYPSMSRRAPLGGYVLLGPDLRVLKKA